MSLTSTVINTTNTTVYTSTGINAVTSMIVCNTTDTTDALFSMHLVSSGGTASTANQIIHKLPLTASETLSLDQEKIILGNGDFIVALSDQANTLSITISALSVS
jgi:hypothetical protein